MNTTTGSYDFGSFTDAHRPGSARISTRYLRYCVAIPRKEARARAPGLPRMGGQACAWAMLTSMDTITLSTARSDSIQGVRRWRAAPMVALALAAVGLTGCYVVPIQPPPGPAQPAAVVAAPPPASATFTARLYPSNDLAAPYGVVMGQVTSDLHGRGVLSATIGGEYFNGEATRMAGSAREGVANAAGNRGAYLNCRYQMRSDTLGVGTCRLNNGAVFNMHVGN